MSQDQGPLSETERIAALREQLAKSVDRIDSLQTSKSWTARVSDHLRRNSNGIINLALASSVFAVALGRLAMKSQHEVEKQDWVEERQRILRQKENVQTEAAAARQQLQTLQQGVLDELQSGGWRLAPVAQRLRQQVEFSQRQQQSAAWEAQRGVVLPSAAAPLQKAAQEQVPSSEVQHRRPSAGSMI